MRSAGVCSIVIGRVIRPALAAACLVTALAAAPPQTQAQCVVVKVNGEPITNDDVEQRRKFSLMVDHRSPPWKDIIEELIDDKLKVQIAHRYRIDLAEKDVDQEYANMARRMNKSPEQFTQAVNQAGVNAATLKAKILADMNWRYVVRSRFRAGRLQDDDKSINPGVESQRKGAEAEVAYDYALRPILLLTPRGNAPLLEARRKEADALRARFASCEAGLADARAQQDVIIRDTITRNSSDLPPAVREILGKTEVGHLTPPEATQDSVQMIAVCGKKEAEPDTPERRTARAEREFEGLSKAYLRKLRRSAQIELMQRCRPRLH
jgi:peptidyl-prolyl cis-trans isomerase SurA